MGDGRACGHRTIQSTIYLIHRLIWLYGGPSQSTDEANDGIRVRRAVCAPVSFLVKRIHRHSCVDVMQDQKSNFQSYADADAADYDIIHSKTSDWARVSGGIARGFKMFPSATTHSMSCFYFKRQRWRNSPKRWIKLCCEHRRHIQQIHAAAKRFVVIILRRIVEGAEVRAAKLNF